MAELVADCPRCGSSKVTFDLEKENFIGKRYNWQRFYEAFCVCRHCHRSTVFILSQEHVQSADLLEKKEMSSLQGCVNSFMRVENFVSLKDETSVEPPDFLPENILSVFNEGATCLAVGCFNASATMFRLCVDLATKSLLPEADEHGLNAKIRRNLGLRLPWLFDNNILPSSMRELSSCIKEDGNDGAHEGSLTKEDAEDLLDFTSVLLERMYTEPERLRLANERRSVRRNKS